VELLDEMVVRDPRQVERRVQLLAGNLAAIPARHAVDLLVVSAFPDDYSPTEQSLIGALNRQGVSVEWLAGRKAVDLRSISSCWLSEEIRPQGLHFRRILCFEPHYRGSPPEVVGDVFRSLIPFTAGSPPLARVAMPLLASGDMGEPGSVMLEAILTAALHWLGIGMPLECIKVVVSERTTEEKREQYRAVFAAVKKQVASAEQKARAAWRYDLFVSYSHQNYEEVDVLVNEVRQARPGARIFLDRMTLQTGMAWQQHLFETLDQCRKVLAVYSPTYLTSKVCMEEFNIALYRHRESPEGVLLPVYLQSAPLPTYLRLIQYEDVREADRAKIVQAAGRIARQL
jgi:hypothetical protein